MEKKKPLTKDTGCSICDFPINPASENGWFDQGNEKKWKYLILKTIKKSYLFY